MNQIANRYDVIRLLGEGGMGSVYLAQDRTADRQVALKVARDPLSPERFEHLKHEFWLMTRLHHPNLVEAYDYGRLDDGSPYLTMEVVEGKALDETLPLSPEQVRDVAIQTARALGYIHAQGFVHCDVKPENLRVMPDGRVKLMDFGLMERTGRIGGPIRGSLSYMAPEVAKGATVDARSDLYSLGIMLYQLASGALPFQAESPAAMLRAHLSQAVPPLDATLPEDLRDLLPQLLAKDPASRPSNAAELLLALGEEGAQGPAYLFSPPLVGRAETLSRFDSGELANGTWTLVAPAGMGKSRLIKEFRFQAQLGDRPFLLAACPPQTGAPYAPIAELLRQLLPLASQHAPEILDAARMSLARLLPELARPEDAAFEMEPQQEKRRLHAAISDLIRAVAEAKGLLLAVEDIDTLDSSSREVLEQLSRLAAEGGLTLLTTRTSEGTGLEAETILWLEPLSQADVRALIEGMIGHAQVPESFVGAAFEAAGGNPQSLSNLLQHLVDTGVIRAERGRWVLPSELPEGALPSDWHDLLRQNLAALSPEAHRIAEAIAMLGRPTSLALLERVPGIPHEETLYQAIDELVQAGLLQGQTEVDFTQRALVALVLEDLSPESTRAWHTRLTDALEAAFAEDSGNLDLLNQLGTHALRSEQPERAIPYCLDAGLRNYALYANEAACAFLEGGLALTPPEPSALRFDLLSALGDAKRMLGDSAAASAAYQEAVAMAETLGKSSELANILVSLGKSLQSQGKYEEAQASLSRSMEVAEASGNHKARIRALMTLGRIYYFTGKASETTPLLEEAASLSREHGEMLTLSESLAFLGFLFSSSGKGQTEKGLTLLKEALAIKESFNDLLGLNEANMMLGNAYLSLGRYTEAYQAFEETRRLNTLIDQRDELVFSQLNLAATALELGEFRDAEAIAKQALTGSRELGSRMAEGMALAMEGMAAMHLGRLGEALTRVDEGLQIALDTRNRYLEMTLNVYRAELLMTLGATEEALALARKTLKDAEETGHSDIASTARPILAALLLRSDEREEVRSLLNLALKEANEAEARGLAAKLLFVQADLLALSKDVMAAQRMAFESLHQAEEVGARNLIGRIHLFLGELHLRNDRRSLASEHLRKAIHLAEEMGQADLDGRALGLLAEVDTLRGDDHRRLSQNICDRLVQTLPAERQEAFRDSWSRTYLPVAESTVQTSDTLEGHLTRLHEDLNAFTRHARGQQEQLDDLQHSNRKMTQLIDFSLKVSQIHDVALVLEMTMDLLLEIVGGKRGFILKQEGEELLPLQIREFPQSVPPEDWRISRSIAEEVFSTEQPLCLRDTRHEARFTAKDAAIAGRTVLSAPLKIRNRVVGSLYVDRPADEAPFDEKDLDVVMSLASVSANAIENASLHSEWEDKSRKLEMLNSLARTITTTLVMEEVLQLVLKSTLDLTQAERGYILLWENEQLVCRSALNHLGAALTLEDDPISRSICQRVLDSAEPLCVDDALSDQEFQMQASVMALNLRTVMCVPLLAKQTVLGVLYVDSQAIVNHFTERDLALLESIAHHAAIAIENAHLYTQLTQRANELEHLVELYEEANMRASTDPLTGLHNRRFFQDQLSRDFAQSRRHHRHLSVILLDIDHFKSFNDTFGHQLGDEVIVAVARVLEGAVRLSDLAARWGGEEFIVALPDTDLDGALTVAERIRQSVSEIQLTDPDGNPLRQITASLGVSSLRPEDARIAELIERSDRALYVAKAGGRNQVQVLADER
ncbi:Serine/threonine-protein kinase PrkC [compost metagenome]